MKEITLFTKQITQYIKGLNVQDKDGIYVPVLQSNRKTGLIGFILCLNRLLHLYDTLIEPGKLEHIKMYKLSQENLELFFGSIRSHGGYNNNPTVRQFSSAYRKLVIQKNNVQNFKTGN